MSSQNTNPLIVYLSANGYLGGAEKVILSLAEGHLETRKYRPFILFFRDGEAVSEARKSGIPHYVLIESFKLGSPLSLIRAIFEIRRMLNKLNPRVLHHTMPYTHIVGSLASFGMGIRKVWFQHGPVGGTLDKIATLFSTDYLLFNGTYLKHLHHLSLPHSAIRVGEMVVPMGVQEPPSIAGPFGNSEIVLGSAGRITSGKAYHKILRALEKTNLPYRFLLAGAAKSEADVQYYNGLRSMANSSVEFMGHQSNMSDFYSSIDVFVHCSENPEPFGLVIAEAMAHGRLVIGMPLGGAADFLFDGKTGLTYTDEEGLVSRLREVLSEKNREPLKKIAEEGSILIRRNYTRARMVACIERIYDELCR